MRIFSRGPKWPTRVTFIREGDQAAASMPIDLGFDAVVIGLGEHRVTVPAGEQRYIVWPASVDHYTYNGIPGQTPTFWRAEGCMKIWTIVGHEETLAFFSTKDRARKALEALARLDIARGHYHAIPGAELTWRGDELGFVRTSSGVWEKVAEDIEEHELDVVPWSDVPTEVPPNPYEQRRNEAIDWFVEHDVDPSIVPDDVRLRPSGRGWTAEVFAKNQNGRTEKDGHGRPLKRQIHIVDSGDPPPTWLVERADRG